MTPKAPSDKAIYSSRIIDTYIKLLSKQYPAVNIADLLNCSDMKAYEVADQSHWFTQEQIDKFYECVVQMTGNPGIAREAGRYAASPEAIGAMRQYIMGLVGPAHAFSLIRNASSKFTRSSEYNSQKLSENSVQITVSPYAGVEEKAFQCENRMGFFEAICMMFNDSVPQIQHPECFFTGGSCCRYIITWKKPSSAAWKRLRDLCAVSLAGICLAAASKAPGLTLKTLVPVSSIIILGLALVANRKEKAELRRSLDNLADSSERLIEQMNINYSNALMANEIGQAISEPTTVDDVLEKVIQVLENRLDFDRGMVLLANKDRTRLVFRAGFGYSSIQLKTLTEMAFNLNKKNSKGAFVVSFREQAPCLIDDIKNLQSDLSQRSIALIEKLGTQSFICCPIICEGESIGILAVDNLKSKRRLMHSDMSQLMGIAPVLGISIRNADLLLVKERQFKSTLQVLAASIDARDPLTAGHSEMVTEYAYGICQTLGINSEEREVVRVAALLHDYGKIGVPDAILKKEGRLTDDEYAIVKTHTDKTMAILSQINFEGAYHNVPIIAGSHHENIDGSGYPQGLKGNNIPLGSRIISVADFFEAITSKRHYRDPMPDNIAYDLLRSHSGSRFDPEIVEAFISYHKDNYGPGNYNGPMGSGGGNGINQRLRRVPCKTNVSVRFNSHATIGTTEDISPKGMFVGVSEPIKEGTIIHLAFNLPEINGPPLEVYAKVIWANQDGEKSKPDFPQGNGIQFTDITKECERTLHDFINKREEFSRLH